MTNPGALRRRREGVLLLVGTAAALTVISLAVIFNWGPWALVPTWAAAIMFVSALVRLAGKESFLRWRRSEQDHH